MSDHYDIAGYGGGTVGFGMRPAVVVVDFQLSFTNPQYPGGRSAHIHRAVENTAELLDHARARKVPVAACNVAWCAKREPKRMLDARDPGDAHRGSQVRDVGQGNGRHAGSFDFPLNQSHGPAADRSDGYQHDGIDPICFEMVDDFGRSLSDQCLRAWLVAHDGIVA